MKLHCAICGTPYDGDRDSRTCSVTCRGKWVAAIRSPRVAAPRPCSLCGQPVLTASRARLVYCEACRHPVKACAECGTSFTAKTRTSRFCSVSCRSTAAGRKAPTGREHPNWRGGSAYYRGPKWRSIRDQVRERDDWRCRECGKSRDEGKLDVHHLVPAAEWDRPGSANEPDNLLTLCVGCHAKRHGLEVDERTRRARERSRRYYQAHRAERIAYAVEHQRDYRARRRATT